MICQTPARRGQKLRTRRPAVQGRVPCALHPGVNLRRFPEILWEPFLDSGSHLMVHPFSSAEDYVSFGLSEAASHELLMSSWRRA